MPISQTPVLVTGATGFVASYVIKDLLEQGYRVRGTVRNAKKQGDTAHLRALAGAETRLELVEADLLAPGAFDVAARGCEYIMHTASPYVIDAKDPQKDLVDPAVQGTRNVLSACEKAGVKRIVLTSSMAAITDEPENDKVLTEDDWNERSSLDRNPYYYSKALAEREAWKLAESARYRLVVVNPFLVIGPSMTKALNPSNQVFADILNGTYPGIMSVTWGLVDVRDVARAHVLAMEKGDASGRYVCANTTISMRDVVDLLKRSGYAQYKLPSMGLDCAVGDFAVRLGSYLQPKGIGSYLRTHIGRTPRFDNRKIREGLGLHFRPLEQSILDTVTDLVRWGHVAPTRD